MNKTTINSLNLKGAKTLANTGISRVILLSNGFVLKLFDPMILNLFKLSGDDIEAKILDAKPIAGSPEILTPTSAVYSENGLFVGYIMPRAKGINYNERDDKLTIKQREDLATYARIHSKLEQILIKNPNIVFPDICTCENIFISDKEQIQLIDYDGLQVGKYRTSSLSTSVGTINEYVDNSKYMTKDNLFTKELDKKSSIILYFLSAFNIDLGRVGNAYLPNGKLITLDDVFSCINLDDQDVCHKVWKLFQDNESNDFLEEDVLRIADTYDLHVLAENNGQCIKKLTRKR